VRIMNPVACAALLIEGGTARVASERHFFKAFGEGDLAVEDLPFLKSVLETKKSFFAGDIREGSLGSRVAAGYPARSLLCIPIIVTNEVRGVLYLDGVKKNAFSGDDQRFLELLSKEISSALERSVHAAQAKRFPERDVLTGVLAREQLREDIEAEISIARRYDKSLSLLALDIDRFREHGERSGRAKADGLLKRMAEVLISNVRVVDKVYRYSGEEFAVLLPGTDKKKALLLAERLQAIIGQEMGEDADDVPKAERITVSIGVASFPLDAESTDGLMHCTDAALAQARDAGGDTVHTL